MQQSGKCQRCSNKCWQQLILTQRAPVSHQLAGQVTEQHRAQQGSHGDGGGQLPRRQDLDPSTIDLAVPDILHANDHRLQAAQQTVLHPWASESYPPMRYRRCPLIFALGVIDAVV
jgi:hypothetical protein